MASTAAATAATAATVEAAVTNIYGCDASISQIVHVNDLFIRVPFVPFPLV